jgi:hypothetical protein
VKDKYYWAWGKETGEALETGEKVNGSISSPTGKREKE